MCSWFAYPRSRWRKNSASLAFEPTQRLAEASLERPIDLHAAFDLFLRASLGARFPYRLLEQGRIRSHVGQK